jgi:hypothetical protein
MQIEMLQKEKEYYETELYKLRESFNEQERSER